MGRPSRSCHMCRTRRIKCDRTKPICNQCVTKRLQCPGYELQFDVIHRSENEAVKCRAQKISTPRRSSGKNISEPSPASASPGNHNLPPLAPAGTLSGGQAVNGYTDLQGTPDESRLHYRNIEIYLSCFRKYIPPLCPLLRPDELTSSNIVSLRESDQPAQKAVALAVLALGEWCWNAGDAPCTATRVDRTNAREAANFLEHHTNRDLHHIRACLLIAFYCGLCGDVCGSKRYVHKAAELLKQDLSPESLRGTITSENSFPIAFWICIALESEIGHHREIRIEQLCQGILRENLLDIPYPSAVEHDLGGRAAAIFQSSVWVCKAESAATAFLSSMRVQISEPEVVVFLSKVAEKLEQFFTPPPPSVLFDFDAPSSDLATARIQASRWNAKAAIYMPFIRRFCDNTHAFGDWHSEDLEKVKRGVLALIGSLRAFHDVSEGLMIMPNVASTAYLQVRNLLLIERCRTSARLRRSLETDWEGLLFRTTLFLRAISEGPSPLTIDTASLTSLREFARGCTPSLIDVVAWDALQFSSRTFGDLENEAGGVQKH